VRSAKKKKKVSKTARARGNLTERTLGKARLFATGKKIEEAGKIHTVKKK